MTEKRVVVAFSGHMTDAPDRPSPRFPEARVPAVRAQIRAALDRQGASLAGVCSAARGADQIFARALLDLGGALTIVLPFPAEQFKGTSVGQGWDASFDELLRADRVTLLPPLYAELPATQEQRNRAFAECNDVIVKTALDLAASTQAEALFLAVYRRTTADAAGGTMDAFQRWQQHGGRVEIIDPMA